MKGSRSTKQHGTLGILSCWDSGSIACKGDCGEENRLEGPYFPPPLAEIPIFISEWDSKEVWENRVNLRDGIAGLASQDSIDLGLSLIFLGDNG